MRTRLLVLVSMIVLALPQGARATVSVTTVSGASPFAPACSGSSDHFYNSEVEPHVEVNPTDPNNVIAIWQQDRFREHGGAQGNVIGYTKDGGATWKTASLPGTSVCAGGPLSRGTDPWVAFGPDGTAYAVSLSMNAPVTSLIYTTNALLVNVSKDGGATWSEPSVVVADAALLLNDKESITVDPVRPGRVYVIWYRFPGVTHISISEDYAKTWSVARPLGRTTGQANEIQALPDGTLVNVFTSGSTPQSIRSTDGGVTWSPPVAIAQGRYSSHSEIRDGSRLPRADVGPDGSVYVVWGTFEGADGYAIAFSRSTDGGLTWPPRALVGSARPRYMFTPTVAVAGDGTVGVSFYDLRNDRSDDDELTTDAWFRWSTDGGATWRERHLSGPFDQYRAPYASGYFLGDYEGLEASHSTFHAIYAQANDTGAPATDIAHARITP